MKEMIARFRSAAPTSKDERSRQVNTGELQQMWWVKDNDANHANRNFTRDEPYYSFKSTSNESDDDNHLHENTRSNRQKFGFKSRKSPYHSEEDRKNYGSYSRNNRTKTAHSDDDDDDLENDDLFASRMAAYERGLAEKTRGRSKYIESPMATANKDGPRYRFVKSPTKSKNTLHDNYDFVATDHASLQRMTGDRKDPVAEHNAPSVDTLLRQAALRSALKIQEKPSHMQGGYGGGWGAGPSMGPSMGPSIGPSSSGGGGGGSDSAFLWGDYGEGKEYSPPRRSKRKKGDAEINKKATATEIGRDLDSTLARLVESFHIVKTEIPPVEEDIKAVIKNEFGNQEDNSEEENEKVLPSSIAQIADDLMISLLPFEMLYKHREEKENEENEKFESERKHVEQVAEERAKDKLLDMIANHWGPGEMENEDSTFANPFSFLKTPFFAEDGLPSNQKEQSDRNNDQKMLEKETEQSEDRDILGDKTNDTITLDNTVPTSIIKENNQFNEDEKYCEEEIKENEDIEGESRKLIDSEKDEIPVGINSINNDIADQMKSLTSLATNRMKEIESLSRGNLLPSQNVDKESKTDLHSPQSLSSTRFSTLKNEDETKLEPDLKDVASSTWQAILATANSRLEKMAKEKLDEETKKVDNLAVMRDQQRKAKALARKEIDAEYNKIIEASNLSEKGSSNIYPYTSSSGVKETSGEICSDLEIHMLCMQKRLGHIEKDQTVKKDFEDMTLKKNQNDFNSLFYFQPDYLRSITEEEKKEKEEIEKEKKKLEDIKALKARAELDAWLDDQGESFILEKAEMLRKEKELSSTDVNNETEESDSKKLSQYSMESEQKKNLSAFNEIAEISRHPIFSTKETGDLYFDEITATFSPRAKSKDVKRQELEDLDEINRLRKRLQEREKDRLVSSIFENQRLSRSDPYPDQSQRVARQEAAKRDNFLRGRTEELSKSRNSLDALKSLREKMVLTAFDV